MTTLGYEGSDVNTPLGVLSVQLRNACQAILNIWEYINALGVTGLQAAPYSMSETDATALFNAYNYLQTVAQIYYGTIAQTPAFDFDSALALYRGGQ